MLLENESPMLQVTSEIRSGVAVVEVMEELSVVEERVTDRVVVELPVTVAEDRVVVELPVLEDTVVLDVSVVAD